MQAAAASVAEVAGALPQEDEVVALSEEYFALFFLLVTPLTWRRSPKLSMFRMFFLPVTCLSTDWANRFHKFKQLQLRLPLSVTSGRRKR